MSYSCPHCGKEYEVPPKWCPCQPYIMDFPEPTYFLCEGSGKNRKCIQLSFREFDGLIVSLQLEGKADEARDRADGLRESNWNLLRVSEHVGVETAVSFSEENFPLREDEFRKFRESFADRSYTSPPC